MPLFEISGQSLKQIGQLNFKIEKDLQKLIESNLGVVFNCRLVGSEFPTGSVHAGRIDTLALSEDHNPVIIEYKKVESSELINQSLYYLSWINDHRGDFEIAVQKSLGKNTEVDWSDIRVICIAPNYRKYDLHAVKVMGANIELWTYRLFKNEVLYFEEVFHKALTDESSIVDGKNPVMVAAGKKAAATRVTGTYSIKEHFEGKPDSIKELAEQIQEFIIGLDPSIEEIPKKFYIAYKTSQNIICMELKKHKIILFLKLEPKTVKDKPPFFRDVTTIGHYGTGDVELSISTIEEFELAKKLIELAYENVGG